MYESTPRLLDSPASCNKRLSRPESQQPPCPNMVVNMLNTHTSVCWANLPHTFAWRCSSCHPVCWARSPRPLDAIALEPPVAPVRRPPTPSSVSRPWANGRRRLWCLDQMLICFTHLWGGNTRTDHIKSGCKGVKWLVKYLYCQSNSCIQTSQGLELVEELELDRKQL